MNRVKKASGWWVCVAAVGLSLSAAAAAPKTAPAPKAAPAPKKDPEALWVDCQGKANATMSTCAQGCSTAKAAGKDDEAVQCLKRCADKLQASQAACDKARPAPPKAPEPVH